MLGFRVRSQPRGARGQECRPGPCLQGDHGPSGLKHYSLEHSKLDFLAFQKRRFYKYLHRNIHIGGFLQDPPRQQLAGLKSAFRGGTHRGLWEGGQETPAPGPRACPTGCLVVWEPRTQDQRLGKTRRSLSGAAVLPAQRLFVRRWSGHKSRLSPAAQLMRTLK